MKTISRFFNGLYRWVSSGKAKAFFDLILERVPDAGPYIDIAAQIATQMTPTVLDDTALAFVKAKYPHLLDGTLTPDEWKLYALAIASDLLQKRFPYLSVTQARLAVQANYALQKTGA